LTIYVGLLRAVNVGGTGKLRMTDLRAICAELGFGRIETYIASGNVVFSAGATAAKLESLLEQRLLAFCGKPVAVFVRSAAEMHSMLAANPFSQYEPRRTYCFVLREKPAADALSGARGRSNEQMQLGRREIYVHYPEGMGKSKLQIPAARSGTARNLSTIATLVAMSART
jgi:uncharacterized protein (DUF1697 family)